MKKIKNPKTIVPIVAIVLLNLFASQPFYMESFPPLHIEFGRADNGSNPDDDDGWSFIQYKFVFPQDPKPGNPFRDLIKQEELLAYYGE